MIHVKFAVTVLIGVLFFYIFSAVISELPKVQDMVSGEVLNMIEEK